MTPQARARRPEIQAAPNGTYTAPPSRPSSPVRGPDCIYGCVAPALLYPGGFRCFTHKPTSTTHTNGDTP